MPITGNWIFTASMDVDADKEALFNEVYDTEHVPSLQKVPGVVSVARVKTDTLRVTIGGETKTVEPTGPRYACIIELDNPDVLTSAAFQGRRCRALAGRSAPVHAQSPAHSA